MTPVKVIFFGDSVCVGQHVSLHEGWVPKSSARLARLGEELGREIVVANASGNGRTTRQALEVMPYEVQSPRPDVLIVQFGMNDCNHWASDGGVPRVSPQAFAANLEEIIARARAAGVRQVLLNTNHPSGRDQEPMAGAGITYEQANAAYNEIIRNVAAAAGSAVRFNDVERAFHAAAGGDRQRLLDFVLPPPDLLHPSAAGHHLYLDVVYPSLESAVREVIAADG